MKKIVLYLVVFVLLVVGVYYYVWNIYMDGISVWDEVMIRYYATLSDGRTFIDKTNELTSIVVWDNQIAGLDKYLIGKFSWDYIEVDIPADEHYSIYYDESKIKLFDPNVLASISEDYEELWAVIIGSEIWYVRGLSWDNVVLDGNPLYTWDDMTYYVDIIGE